VQETRGWDDAKQKTFSQRSKENADDYRYMPDPDIPPIVLDDDYVANIKAEMPLLPDDYREKLKGIGIEAVVIEDIIANPPVAMLVSFVLAKGTAEDARRTAFWMMQVNPVDENGETPELAVTIEELIGLSKWCLITSLVPQQPKTFWQKY